LDNIDLACEAFFFNFYFLQFKVYFLLLVIFLIYYLINYKYIIWGLGIGDWGLGIGDWAQSPIPNPQYFLNTFIFFHANK